MVVMMMMMVLTVIVTIMRRTAPALYIESNCNDDNDGFTALILVQQNNTSLNKA